MIQLMPVDTIVTHQKASSQQNCGLGKDGV